MKPYYQDSSVTIYHGDCREVLPSLEAVGLVLTDPPYGIGIKYGVYNDDPKTYWEWFLPSVEMFRVQAKAVVFTHRVAALRYLSGWDWVGVWNKPGSFSSRIGNSFLLPHWEPIFFYGVHSYGVHVDYASDVFTFNPNNDGAARNQIGREKWKAGGFEYHPCPKPMALYKSLLKPLTTPNGRVCDPFMGSGTTLRAAKDMGVAAVGIEIDERYCEIAAKRMGQEVFDFA